MTLPSLLIHVSPRAYGKGLPGLPGKALAIGHNTASDTKPEGEKEEKRRKRKNGKRKNVFFTFVFFHFSSFTFSFAIS